LYKRNHQAYAGIIIVVCIMLIGLVPTAEGTRFVLASWSFPDEYGQGMHSFTIWENSTGEWLVVRRGSPFDYPWYYYETHVFEWNYTVGIKLWIDSYFNSTLAGVSDSTQGRNNFRHNVTVVDAYDTLVFSQQNFTYLAVNDYTYDPIWIYSHHL